MINVEIQGPNTHIKEKIEAIFTKMKPFHGGRSCPLGQEKGPCFFLIPRRSLKMASKIPNIIQPQDKPEDTGIRCI